MEQQHIKLTYESLIAILQGKEFHLTAPEYHFIFHPPFDGVFLTHDQVYEIRASGQMDVIRMIEKIQEYKEERDNNGIESDGEKDAAAHA